MNTLGQQHELASKTLWSYSDLFQPFPHQPNGSGGALTPVPVSRSDLDPQAARSRLQRPVPTCPGSTGSRFTENPSSRGDGGRQFAGPAVAVLRAVGAGAGGGEMETRRSPGCSEGQEGRRPAPTGGAAAASHGLDAPGLPKCYLTPLGARAGVGRHAAGSSPLSPLGAASWVPDSPPPSSSARQGHGQGRADPRGPRRGARSFRGAQKTLGDNLRANKRKTWTGPGGEPVNRGDLLLFLSPKRRRLILPSSRKPGGGVGGGVPPGASGFRGALSSGHRLSQIKALSLSKERGQSPFYPVLGWGRAKVEHPSPAPSSSLPRQSGGGGSRNSSRQPGAAGDGARDACGSLGSGQGWGAGGGGCPRKSLPGWGRVLSEGKRIRKQRNNKEGSRPNHRNHVGARVITLVLIA